MVPLYPLQHWSKVLCFASSVKRTAFYNVDQCALYASVNGVDLAVRFTWTRFSSLWFGVRMGYKLYIKQLYPKYGTCRVSIYSGNNFSSSVIKMETTATDRRTIHNHSLQAQICYNPIAWQSWLNVRRWHSVSLEKQIKICYNVSLSSTNLERSLFFLDLCHIIIACLSMLNT